EAGIDEDGIVSARALAAHRRNDEEIWLEARIGRQPSTTNSDFAKPIGHHIAIEVHEQPDDDALMSTRRRRRHEQFAVDKLVTRALPLALADEAIDLVERPNAVAKGRHGHKMLGV